MNKVKKLLTKRLSIQKILVGRLFYFDAGYFCGENPVLLKIVLFELFDTLSSIDSDRKFTVLFNVQVHKYIFSISFE